MTIDAVESEYEDWEDGLRHKPTNIRVRLAYQSVEGDWTLETWEGNPGKYDEKQVVRLAGEILVKKRK